jgi:tRNA1Val (adenine37-N6)-methyltransferase
LQAMANTYFQFKQFTVEQERCAMKVCTDACLLGAYTANAMADGKITANNVLDIGTGTGLLSLMLAQKTSAVIDAVEIDKPSYYQARENFEESPWKERLNIFHSDILQFNPQKKYDCIISNPPFFENDLKSDDGKKNTAKHDTSLTLQQLLQAVIKYLEADGIFIVLLPYHRISHCLEEAEKAGLYLTKKVLVKQTPLHAWFRGMLFFSRQQTDATKEEISIRDKMGDYTIKFIDLLKDYYLYL